MTTGKSLLFVGSFPLPAAVERYVSGEVALRLRALGWSVQNTSRQPGRIGRFAEITRDVWRARRGISAACVDLYSGPAYYWADLACRILRQKKRPYVLILRGGSLPEFAGRHQARFHHLFSRAAAVTCPSAYLRAEMKQLGAGMILLPNALEVKRYKLKEFPRVPRHLVWLRAFHEIYNPELAVTVLAKVREKHADIRLTMMGPDKDGSLQKTQAVARRLGLDGAVSFPGAVSKQDVPARLGEGDIFINTTDFDNTPVSVLEAMACGLPVVTTNVGGIPYMLKDGENALLVPPANAEAMADAVIRLLREPDFASRLGRNGRNMVEDFDWGMVLPRWEELIKGVISGRRPA